MKAVLLAGGKGTRLAPYTTILPKPLMPIGEMPILEIIIRQLTAHGVTEIIVCVGHMAAILESFFGKGDKFGVKISYSLEDQPLGTAGPLGLLEGLDDTFFVANGDLLTTISFSEMLSFHRSHGKIATVGLASKDVKIDLGVIEVEPDNAIKAYIEKPTLNYKVSMGIYVFEPGVLKYIRGRGRLDLPDLVLELKHRGEKPMAYDAQCRWLDIGRVDDYATAVETFERDRELYLPKKRQP